MQLKQIHIFSSLFCCKNSHLLCIVCFFLLDFCSINNSVPETYLPKPVTVFYETGINLKKKKLMFQVLFIFEMKESLVLFANGLYTWSLSSFIFHEKNPSKQTC